MRFPTSRLDNARGLLRWLRARGIEYRLLNDGTAQWVATADYALTDWGQDVLDALLPAIVMALRAEAGRCVACGTAFPSQHTDYCLPCLWARVEGFPCYQGKRRAAAEEPAVETPEREEAGDLWEEAA